MKVIAIIYTIWQLLTALNSQAQVVIDGDSMYHTLRPGKDFIATIVAELGRHYRKKEVRSWYTAKLRSGVCISGTNVTGYALRYKKLGVTFCVDNETGRLNQVQFDSTAAIVSVRGIRPGAASFAEVVEKYGLPYGSDQNSGAPKIGGFWEVDKRGVRRRYLTLSYPHIRFISWGNRVDNENLLKRKVQEIWLR